MGYSSSEFALYGCVGAGVHRVVRISDPSATSSPPNKKKDLESCHFTEEECNKHLWDEFTADYKVAIPSEVRERIYVLTLGYPFYQLLCIHMFL